MKLRKPQMPTQYKNLYEFEDSIRHAHLFEEDICGKCIEDIYLENIFNNQIVIS